MDNQVNGATRPGIVVIQETPDSLASENVIRGNTVTDSGSDGIQIQGDNNQIMSNRIENSGGYGIHLCSAQSDPACVAPGNEAEAEDNELSDNQLENNALSMDE